MQKRDACCPKTVEECNIATEAVMLEIAKRLKFDSKFLVLGQENVLTLHEYEALFLEDMKICEDTLDVILHLARKQKAYLDAIVTAKQLEVSMRETIADTFTRVSEQRNNSIELRKRVEKGDFSFFLSTAAQGNPMSSNSGDVESTTLTTISSVTVTDDKIGDKSKSHFKPPMDFDTSSVSSYRFAERPQLSDVARRLLGQMEKKTHIVTPRVETQLQNCGLSRNTDTQNGGKTVCDRVSGSGGSNLDGSIIMDGGEKSDQNGIRDYSPVVKIPPQPNFDDTGMESLSEPVRVPHSIIRPEPLRPTDGSKSTLNRNTEKCDSMLQPENSTEYAEGDVKEGAECLPTLTSSYRFCPRPKFTSSVGRVYNK